MGSLLHCPPLLAHSALPASHRGTTKRPAPPESRCLGRSAHCLSDTGKKGQKPQISKQCAPRRTLACCASAASGPILLKSQFSRMPSVAVREVMPWLYQKVTAALFSVEASVQALPAHRHGRAGRGGPVLAEGRQHNPQRGRQARSDIRRRQQAPAQAAQIKACDPSADNLQAKATGF